MRTTNPLRASIFSVALVVASGFAQADSLSDQLPAAAPLFEAAYLNRVGRLHLSDLKGKVVLINFWASWCAPCRYEMPHFQKLHDRFTSDGFEVVAINTMDERAKAVAFLEKHHFSYHLLLDEDNEIAASYGVIGPPQTFLLNGDGEFVPIPDPNGGPSKRAVYDPTIWTHPTTVKFLERLIKQN